MDRLFLELNETNEEIYQRLCRVIEDVNVIISTYSPPGMDWSVNPIAGTVAFASGKQGWGFTLQAIGRTYARKIGSDPHKVRCCFT